ncbi:MAG: 30S ribosomal protein S6 [Caldilinea sp.]|jgi:small subunit ribosomal protein S6|uniref:30S ribosomal protein S6 n=1 Tax=Caldilinea sp. TaxID=2293560 RepID=UPI00309B4D7F
MNGANERQYELVYILHPQLDEAGINSFDARLCDVITAQGGRDIATELWGKRTLAYPINHQFEGYYILHRFQMPPTGTEEVERLLRYSEDVMRFLLMRKDE